MSNTLDAIIYDAEIKKAILGRNEQPLEGIEYCEGFHDFPAMGISCMGAYDYKEDRTRLFMGDNMEEFLLLRASRLILITFNGLGFDDKLIAATFPNQPARQVPAMHYDILVEVWAAAGLEPTFNFRTHGGYGLDALAAANGLGNKTGHGAKAPVDYQQKRYGSLIDYCLQDIALTKKLFDKIIAEGTLVCPKTGGKLTLRQPGAAA